MGTMTTSDVAALRKAVASAILAPSIHNTQPWRFVLRDDALEMFADRRRQLAVLDPSGRQLHLSLGCALFNARVSLSAAGYGGAVSRLPDPSRPDLVARITLGEYRPHDAEIAALAPALSRRQTNRRKFTDESVPAKLVDNLVAAASAEGAALHEVRSEDDRMTIARLSQRADAAQNADAAYRAELRAWTTTDPDRRDGVRAAAVPHVDGSAQDDVPIRDFDSQGAGWLPAQTRSSTRQCLLLLGTAEENAKAWLRGGEALERVWLQTTRAGYVAGIFTQPIEVTSVRSELRRELRLSMHPHALLRIGKAALTPATLRRHVSDVLEDRAQA
jgi:nitroreductase